MTTVEPAVTVRADLNRFRALSRDVRELDVRSDRQTRAAVLWLAVGLVLAGATFLLYGAGERTAALVTVVAAAGAVIATVYWQERALMTMIRSRQASMKQPALAQRILDHQDELTVPLPRSVLACAEEETISL